MMVSGLLFWAALIYVLRLLLLKTVLIFLAKIKYIETNLNHHIYLPLLVFFLSSVHLSLYFISIIMPQKTPTLNPNRRIAAQGKGIESNDLRGLQAICEAEVSNYNSVKNTDSAYNGHRSLGRGFLKNLVARREKDEVDGLIDDVICTAVLAKAFDNGPLNKYSALALEMFIVQKCFNEGCGKDTAEGISSSFTALWDNMYVNKLFILDSDSNSY